MGSYDELKSIEIEYTERFRLLDKYRTPRFRIGRTVPRMRGSDDTRMTMGVDEAS
jgi:hypothetical protein